MAYQGYTGYGVQQDVQRKRAMAELLANQTFNAQGSHPLDNIARALSGVGAVYGANKSAAADKAYGGIEREAENIRASQGAEAADQFMNAASLGPTGYQRLAAALG